MADGEGAAAQPLFRLNVNPPSHLETAGPGVKDKWKEWKGTWERYLLLSGASTQPNAYIKALLLHSLGPECVKIHDGFVFTEGQDRDDPQVLITKFNEHFEGGSRDFIERLKFYRRQQGPSETFDSFLSDLRVMIKGCGFCNCIQNTLIMDRIILGHKNETVRDKLMAQENLELQAVINLCRAAEATECSIKILNDEETKEVSKITHKKYRSTKKAHSSTHKEKHKETDRYKDRHRNQNKERSKEIPKERQMIMKCKFCTGQHERNKEKCPAWGKKCVRCKAPNHFANSAACKEAKAVNYLAADSDSDSTEGSVCSVTVCQVKDSSGLLYCNLLLDDATIKHQIDSGSSVCILPQKYVGNRSITPNSVRLQVYNGTSFQALGRCKVKVVNPRTNKKWNIHYVVVKEELMPIIGRSAAEAMGMITTNYDQFQLVNVIKKEFDLKPYDEVFGSQLGNLPGDPVRLSLKDDASPVIRPARSIPEALRVKVKKQLDDMCDKGIIALQETPTDWCNQMVICQKKSGDIRICLDPTSLNQFLRREHYKLPTLQDILPRLNGATMFSTCDLKHGYWHMQLDEESSTLTTMATPWGRYRWRRVPFGLNISSEVFQKRLHQALDGLIGIACVADDILVYGKTKKEHDANLEALLQRCQCLGIRLNKDKCEFHVSEVPFMGHVISKDGLKVDPKKVEAITDMPTPKSKKDIERLRGMVNYLSQFVPKLSDVFAPLNELTHLDVEWQWSTAQTNSFTKVKKMIASAPTLAYYDASKDLLIQTDASSQGIGAVALQDGRPVAYASRALSDVEKRYATIEKEMLAVVYGLEKFHQITYGRKVQIQSDHKALESIVRKELERAPKRLQGMLVRALAYNIQLTYLPGKKMVLADALSRAHLRNNGNPQADLEKVNSLAYVPMTSEKITLIREHTSQDANLRKLKEYIEKEWPAKEQINKALMPFYGIQDELHAVDGLLFRGQRLIVPQGLQKMMATDVHKGHLGIQSCLRRARECMFWPKMNEDIQELVRKCETCNSHQSANMKETLQPHEIPERPWDKVGIDLFSIKDKTYMVTVCYYSNFIELDRLYSTTSDSVIRKIKTHCARYGIVSTIISDNGPQFASKEFQKFCQEWGITHKTSSPHHPQSNGKAEAAVKTIKTLLTKSAEAKEDPYIGLLNLRNTPQQDVDISPAQRLFGRRTKTLLPTTKKLLEETVNRKQVRAKLNKKSAKQATSFNKHAKDLPTLKPGMTVRVKPTIKGQKKWARAVVKKQISFRKYLIEQHNGVKAVRNRVHLKVVLNQMSKDAHCGIYRGTDYLCTPQTMPPPATRTIADPNDGPHVHHQARPEDRIPVVPQRRSTRPVKIPSKFKDYKLY